MAEKKVRWEKMSKARGNVVTPDEVIFGVAELAHGYEFRHPEGSLLEDYKKWGVWRNNLHDSMFYTSTRTGKSPVFLHEKGNPVPGMLLIDGEERVQHADKTELWFLILVREQFPDAP